MGGRRLRVRVRRGSGGVGARPPRFGHGPFGVTWVDYGVVQLCAMDRLDYCLSVPSHCLFGFPASNIVAEEVWMIVSMVRLPSWVVLCD